MAQRLTGAGLALLGLIIIVLSMRLPQPLAATRIEYGPGFFPIILGIVVAAAGVLLAAARPHAAGDGDEEGPSYELRDFGKPLVVCLAALAYILLAPEIGFLIVAPVILIGLLLLGGVPLWKAFLVGVVGSITVYIVFHKLLLVPLPLGLLAPWGAFL